MRLVYKSEDFFLGEERRPFATDMDIRTTMTESVRHD